MPRRPTLLPGRRHRLAVLLTLLATGTSGWSQGIYTCTDSKGRRLTSDRPIVECIDREQQELNPSGTLRRRIGPSLTAQEQAAQDARDREAAEERARQAEERRRDRALLTRYPNRQIHDRERTEALHQVDEVIRAAQKRVTELLLQRKQLDVELEFYAKDLAKAPPALRRQVEENTQSQAVQRKFIGDQEDEKRRISRRFDEELVKLRQVWALAAPAAGTASAASAPAPAPAASSVPARR